MSKDTVLFIDSTSHTTSPSCQRKFSGVCRFAVARGWKVVPRILSCNHKHAERRIRDIAPQGCIVNATRLLNTLPPGLFGKVPVVYLDTDPGLFDDGTTVVTHDSFGTGRRAALELLALHIRQFYYVPYRFSAYWSEQRWRGFSDCLAEREFQARLLPLKTSGIAHLPEPGSGILTANDEMARLLLPQLAKRGLRIPQDITLVSADDSDFALRNGITSIRIDFERGGYAAAEALAKLMERRPCEARGTYGDVCIQYRESTRHFAHKLPRIPEAVELIRAQACNGLTAASVVDFIGTPRRTAEVRFRLATGHTIQQEIQSVRLERVFNLLASPARSISSLTDLCGYSTPQALRKAFRRHTGASMNEWRKRNIHEQRTCHPSTMRNSYDDKFDNTSFT